MVRQPNSFFEVEDGSTRGDFLAPNKSCGPGGLCLSNTKDPVLEIWIFGTISYEFRWKFFRSTPLTSNSYRFSSGFPTKNGIILVVTGILGGGWFKEILLLNFVVEHLPKEDLPFDPATLPRNRTVPPPDRYVSCCGALTVSIGPKRWTFGVVRRFFLTEKKLCVLR